MDSLLAKHSSWWALAGPSSLLADGKARQWAVDPVLFGLDGRQVAAEPGATASWVMMG